jgi:hypothetical protein
MCECWDPKQDVYNTPACRVLRDAFEDDDQNLCKKITDKDLECIKTKYQLIEKAKVKSNKNEYNDEYTFEKVRVKYNEDGLTTEEKKRMRMSYDKPSTMEVVDSHKQQCPQQQSTPTQPASQPASSLDEDDIKFLDNLNKPQAPVGFWETFSRLLFG